MLDPTIIYHKVTYRLLPRRARAYTHTYTRTILSNDSWLGAKSTLKFPCRVDDGILPGQYLAKLSTFPARWDGISLWDITSSSFFVQIKRETRGGDSTSFDSKLFLRTKAASSRIVLKKERKERETITERTWIYGWNSVERMRFNEPQLAQLWVHMWVLRYFYDATHLPNIYFLLTVSLSLPASTDVESKQR